MTHEHNEKEYWLTMTFPAKLPHRFVTHKILLLKDVGKADEPLPVFLNQ